MDGLGDRKPSMLMNEMLALMDGHKRCLLIEQLFIEQMPDDIHLIFADEIFTDPRQLAAREARNVIKLGHLKKLKSCEEYKHIQETFQK